MTWRPTSAGPYARGMAVTALASPGEQAQSLSAEETVAPARYRSPRHRLSLNPRNLLHTERVQHSAAGDAEGSASGDVDTDRV